MKIIGKLLCILLLMAILLTQVQATTDIEEVIADSCRYGLSADLREYGLSHSQLDQIFQRLYAQGALPWYTTGDYKYTYDESTGVVWRFTPENLPESYDRDLYERKLAEFMDQYILPDMKPEEIALAVHDRLILMGQYDESLQKETAYDLLVDGTGICSAYTVLYQDILNRAGVPCISVTSEAMKHTWNLVQLEGKWYHVDLTWDDPTPDVYGAVRHDYFLLTDAQISGGDDPHYGWGATVTCDDDKYRLAYWRDTESPVLFPGDGYAYYLQKVELAYKIVKRNLDTGEETAIFRQEKPTVLNFGQGSYTYYHTGLSLWDGKLYFGTLNQIHAMDTRGNREVIYEFDTAATSRYIYSCYVSEDVIYMTTATHEGDFSTAEVPLEVSQEALAQRHTHSYTQTRVDATCTVTGYQEYTCQCGLTYQSGHSRLPHSYAPIEDKDQKTREACTVCGEIHITGNAEPVAETPQVRDRSNMTIVYVVAGSAFVGALAGLIFKKKK